MWVTPRTWVTAEMVTSAQMNQDVRDNTNALRNDAPGAHATRAANQAGIVSGVSTALVFDTEIYDNDGIWTGANGNRFTPQTTGRYIIGACAEWSANPVSAWIAIVDNGGTKHALSQVVGDYRVMAVVAEINFGALGAWIEVQVLQNSGGNLSIVKAASYTPEFWMRRLGL